MPAFARRVTTNKSASASESYERAPTQVVGPCSLAHELARVFATELRRALVTDGEGHAGDRSRLDEQASTRA
jgi:hypothetical protein